MKFEDIIKLVEDNLYSAFFYTPVYFKKAFSYLLIKPIEIISVYNKEDLKYAFKFIQKLIDKIIPLIFEEVRKWERNQHKLKSGSRS